MWALVEPQFAGALATFLVALFSAEWVFIIWLSRQFTKVYCKMDELADKILGKLEYHERHDDVRFDNIRKDIFSVQLRNAAKDGYLPNNIQGT